MPQDLLITPVLRRVPARSNIGVLSSQYPVYPFKFFPSCSFFICLFVIIDVNQLNSKKLVTVQITIILLSFFIEKT
jgi:hypothetical protein